MGSFPPAPRVCVWVIHFAVQKLTQNYKATISPVQSLSQDRLFVTPWTVARQASLSITNSWSLLKLKSIKSVMPSNHLILCLPQATILQIKINFLKRKYSSQLLLSLASQSFTTIWALHLSPAYVCKTSRERS